MFGRLNRTLHVSWLVAWFSLALIAGVGLAFWYSDKVVVAGWMLAPAFLFLAFALFKRAAWVVLLVVIAGVSIGFWHGSDIRLETKNYEKYVGQTVVLHGTVADDASHKNGQTGLKLKNVSINNERLGGQAWAGTFSNLTFKRSDSVTLEGKLKTGFGVYAASMSYAKLTALTRPAGGENLRNVRDNFAAGLRKAVPEPEASLGLGYLTGQHNDLQDTLIKQLQLVGLIHLVIAGGYNVTILVRFARRKAGKISKYLALLSAGGLLLGLTLIAGFTAPMARTFVVTGLSLAVWYYGRKIHPLVLLPVAAAITAIINPEFVWGDVGWYLTFVAYGGLIMLAPMIKEMVWHNQDSGEIKQILIDTLAVQIVCMPLMAFAFQQYSVYGLPANLLVLPLMPLTMLCTAVAGFAGMLLPQATSQIIGWPANILLRYTDNVTTWFANAPGSEYGASLSAVALAASYTIILALVIILWRKTHYNFREENIVE